MAGPGDATGGTGAAEDIPELIHALRHLFRARQYRALGGPPHHLTSMEGRVLTFLGRHPGATQGALVAGASRDKGQVARLIAGLKGRGLVTAQPAGQGRRSPGLHLTDDGRLVLDKVEQERSRSLAVAVRDLDGDQQRLLVSLLRRLRDSLESPD